jgi:hypothetical protein
MAGLTWPFIKISIELPAQPEKIASDVKLPAYPALAGRGLRGMKPVNC